MKKKNVFAVQGPCLVIINAIMMGLFYLGLDVLISTTHLPQVIAYKVFREIYISMNGKPGFQEITGKNFVSGFSR